MRPLAALPPRRSLAFALTALLVATAGCGGDNDPLPAASGGDPVLSGGVSVTAVSEATEDGGVWLTRFSLVTVSGRAPADSIVEAFPSDSSRLVAATTAGTDGGYALALPVGQGSNVFALRARSPGAAPGPSSQLRVFRRTTPPSPFTVGELPQATNAESVLVQGATEADIVVKVRVTGGASPVEVSKPAGTPLFEARVLLRRNQENRLEISGEELAGNQTSPVVRVVLQDSSAPTTPEVDPIGGPVASTATVLTGRAPGASKIEATGPGEPASTSVGGDGSFSLGVELTREGENLFAVVAIDGVGNRSPATSVRVVRDLTAPGVPSEVRVNGEAVSPPEPVTVPHTVLLVVDGRAEPGARVVFSAANASASATAGSEDGGFSVSLGVPGEGTYPADLRATDGAGNSGDAFAFTVVVEPPAPEPPPAEPSPSPDQP